MLTVIALLLAIVVSGTMLFVLYCELSLRHR